MSSMRDRNPEAVLAGQRGRCTFCSLSHNVIVRTGDGGIVLVTLKKYHGLGNDYLIYDPNQNRELLQERQIQLLCRRNTGVGADGILSGPVFENEKIKVLYIVENKTTMNEVPEGCMNALTSLYSNLRISKLGLTEQQLQSITPNFEFDIEQTEEKSASGNILVMMLMSIVLFYAIYFCAYQVSSSITTEKTSKIIETLVTSTSPKTIVLGKTIGIGLVGLAQMILIVATALISAKTFLEPGVLDSVLDMSNVTPYLGIMTAIYFILGYLAYALLYALTGSTVSKPEDIQSANSPVAILAVIGFYLSYFTMMNPTSKLNLFASLFPISSPFCMPFRIMMGLANSTDVIISIAILVVTIIVIAKVAIKIYSNAILNYGTKMNIKDIIKMYKEKQS